MEKRHRAILFLLLAAFLWSTGGLLIKSVDLNPIAIAGFRSFIAMLVLLAFLRRPGFTPLESPAINGGDDMNRGSIPYRKGGMKTPSFLTGFTWSLPQIGGAVAYSMTVTLFVAATKLTTAANAILLQYTAPVYVALLGAWFLGERTKWFDWIIIVVVMAGMVLFFLDRLTPGNIWGNVCAILSGISFAFLVIFMRKQKASSTLETAVLGNLFTGLIGLPFMFESMPSAGSWAGLIFLGLVQLGLSYVLYSEAIKHVSAIEGILIPGIEPILNPIWVFLVLGERPGKWALAGGLVVLIAVTIRCVIAAVPSLATGKSTS